MEMSFYSSHGPYTVFRRLSNTLQPTNAPYTVHTVYTNYTRHVNQQTPHAGIARRRRSPAGLLRVLGVLARLECI